VYENVGQFLESATIPWEEIQKSIIGTIGDIDTYQLPDAKGFNALLNILASYTQEDRQHLRDQILGAQLEDFRHFGRLIADAKTRAALAIMASPERIEKELASLPEPLLRITVASTQSPSA